MTTVVLAPDKFKGSLTARQVADALALGLAEVAPHWRIVRAPVADGGDGTVAAAVAAGWDHVEVPTTGPTGRERVAGYARCGTSAVVELAAAVGLDALPGGQKDGLPGRQLNALCATTFGLGTVLRHALDGGARDIVVGLGGSASTDGGAGLLQALGVGVLDAEGGHVGPGGAELLRATRLDLSGLHPAAREARFTLACDVDNPLLGPDGAAAVYGPQKGATVADVALLDRALAHWARLVHEATGRDLSSTPGAGAAGGTAFGAMALLRARPRPGIDTVLQLLDFPATLAGADLVITGEGSLDEQSLHGKAPVGVAAAARAAGVPVIAVAGRNTLDAEQLRRVGIRAAYALADLEPELSRSIAQAAELLRRIGRSVAETATAVPGGAAPPLGAATPKSTATPLPQGEPMAPDSFTALHDLASRTLGGSVTCANDELFAQRENLIKPEAPYFDPSDFGHKGKVYDGWETRRRRDAGHDYAIVRLGSAGIIRGVVVDTAYFKGNYPPFISVEAASVEGYPSAEDLLKADWHSIVAKSPAQGDTANAYPVADERCFTHVRLSIFPDGGVARLRVHGEVVPDPRFLEGTVDLLAAENGGMLVGCSDAFYASPANIILPGRARNMGEGWENSRRRGGGNDYAVFALAAAGVPRHVEIDTSYYVGNAPGWVRLSTIDARTASLDDEAAWVELLPRTAVQPDTRHRFAVPGAPAATHLRLDVYPDGGLSRLRLFGELDGPSLAAARRRWWDALPTSHQERVPELAPR